MGDRYVPQIIPDVSFDELHYSPTRKVNMSLIQRGSWSKSSFMEYLPPALEEYTWIKPQQYFILFFCILLLQTFMVMIAKYFTSDLFQNLPWSEKIFHAMECINFAFPYQDWDHDGGNGKQHYMRMLATRREVQINLLINTVFNLVLLLPLPVLCKALNVFLHFL